MKNLKVISFLTICCLITLFAWAAGESIQRRSFTTNAIVAGTKSVELTNIYPASGNGEWLQFTPQTGIRWRLASGVDAQAGIMFDALHSGSYLSHELHIDCLGDLSLNFGYGDNGGRVQLGPSGYSYTKATLQYQRHWRAQGSLDQASEILEFATKYNSLFHNVENPGIVGVPKAVDNVEVEFYRQIPGSSGGAQPFAINGNLGATMRQAGWYMRGYAMQERQASVTAGSTYVVDFSASPHADVSFSAPSVTLSSSGWINGATNYVRKVIYLRSSGGNVTFVYPTTSWNTNGVPMPATITAAQMIRLELEAVGAGGEVNVQVVSCQNLSDNSFSWDADALTFFTRASITDGTQKGAVNQLVQNAKANGWWTACDAIYPMVGGNATAHSKNLKANTFNITWVNTPTHNASGVTFNGTTQYGDSTFTPSTAGGVFAQNSAHLFVYSGTTTIKDNSTQIGTLDAAPRYAVLRVSSGSFLGFGPNSSGQDGTVSAAADFRGPLMITRTTSSTTVTAIRSGYATTSATTSTTVPTTSIFIGAEFNGGPFRWSDFTCSGASIGSGISSALWTQMRADWDTYQTALGGGRKVP